MAQTDFKTIEDYISTFPVHVQEILQKLRQAIGEAAPESEEVISYQMPTFKLYGNLVHFAAYKGHVGFYPAPSAIEAFEKELAPYKTSKGSVRFPLDKALPWPLIQRMVRFRVKENLEAGKKKRERKKRPEATSKRIPPSLRN